MQFYPETLALFGYTSKLPEKTSLLAVASKAETNLPNVR